MIPYRAVLIEWWFKNSPYWRGYRAGLKAHVHAAERYQAIQRAIRDDDGARMPWFTPNEIRRRM